MAPLREPGFGARVQFLVNSTQIEVNVPDWPHLAQQIEARFAVNEGFALATLNMDHLVKLESDIAFGTAYRAQDMVVADGNPIVWMSRIAGRPVSLLAGSDMVVGLAKLAQRCDVGVALLGSTQDSLERAAEALRQAVTGLDVVLCLAPPFGFDPAGAGADAMFEELNASGARLCFLALGAPKQEIFAARGRKMAPQIGFASIGAGLDFLAGSQKRAPLWVRKLAMEWLWRLVTNPRRLAMRYLHSFRILPGHLWRSAVLRFRR